MDSRTALCLRSLCKANSGADEYQKGRKRFTRSPFTSKSVCAEYSASTKPNMGAWQRHPLTTILMIGQLGWHTALWAPSQEYAQTASVIGPQRGPNAELRLTRNSSAPHSMYNLNPTLEMLIHEQPDCESPAPRVLLQQRSPRGSPIPHPT